MIAVLREAAEIAAAAGDANNCVRISLCRAGFIVSGHLQAIQGSTTFTETVLWADLEKDPHALSKKVTQVAGAVNRWCDEKPVIKVLAGGAKRSFRWIQPEELPLAIVSALAILIAIPIGGGWLQ